MVQSSFLGPRLPPNVITLPHVAKSALPGVGHEDLPACIQAFARDLVHGSGGLFRFLNPGDAHHPAGFSVVFPDHTAHGVEQRYLLIGAVNQLLASGASEIDIALFADQVQRAAERKHAALNAQAQTTVTQFLAFGRTWRTQHMKWTQTASLSKDIDPATLTRIESRLAQIRWLEHVFARTGPDFTTDFTRVATKPPQDALKELDARFHHATSSRSAKQIVAGELRPRPSVGFFRFAADTRTRLVPPPAPHNRDAAHDAPASQDLPARVLQDLATGDLHRLEFRGTSAQALEHVRTYYGTTPKGRRLAGRVVLFDRIDGTHPGQIVTLETGQRFLLITHPDPY